MRSVQCCAICAWRENCAKKFCVADGGARCPDFTRDVAIREPAPATGPDGKSGSEGEEAE